MNPQQTQRVSPHRGEMSLVLGVRLNAALLDGSTSGMLTDGRDALLFSSHCRRANAMILHGDFDDFLALNIYQFIIASVDENTQFKTCALFTFMFPWEISLEKLD